MSRRAAIRMSDEEVVAFLDGQRTVICASAGRDGWPHLMPLWYVLRDGVVWAWTYAASQKVRNLERDPRATLQVEAGERYAELRGVMIKAETAIHRELATVLALGEQLHRRYTPDGAVGEEFMDVVRTQAPKRVALQFTPRAVASWDHRKLGGVY